MKDFIEIERISEISKSEFYRRYVKQSKPVVITGLVDHWPALSKWTPEYFISKFGEVKAQAYIIKGNSCDVNTDTGSVTRPVSLSQSMGSIAENKLDGGWAIASPISLFPEDLKEDYITPEYCADGKFLRSVTFIGPNGSVSPIHQDLPENIYVMVKGSKKIILFPPLSSVYPNSRFSKLPNHAQIDPENPDYTKFPKLKDAQPYVVELHAGETLFIPSLWWHYLRNLEQSVAINFWWSQGWKLPIAWTAAMYKKWRGI